MQTLIRAASSLLFPQENACHLCESFLMHGGILCPECESQLWLNRLMGDRCMRKLHLLSYAMSALRYQDAARQMVLQLKYQSDRAMAVPLGEAMCLTLMQYPSLYRRMDEVVPVPLHPSRQYERGYNQAELLAQSLCRPLRLPVRADVLVRTRATGSQVGRSRSERLHALRHAFDVQNPALVRGRHILLVDDVLTTGATAITCAEALLCAGAKEVALITACRA